MNPFIELMQAGALIMLLFAVVLIFVVLRNVEGPTMKLRVGPVVIGGALLLFATPVYAAVISSSDFRFSSLFRVAAAILLPVGLYLLTPFTGHQWSGDRTAGESRDQDRAARP